MYSNLSFQEGLPVFDFLNFLNIHLFPREEFKNTNNPELEQRIDDIIDAQNKNIFLNLAKQYGITGDTVDD